MAIERFRNLNLPNFYAGLAIEDNEFDQNLENMGFLHSRRTCECGGNMSYRNAKPNRRYGTWRCTTRDCRREVGYLGGTFFEGSHLTTKEIVHLSYLWARKFGTFDDIGKDVGVDRHTITDWHNFFRDICAEYFVQNRIQIGGQGVIVEIDETCIVRRKYNRGQLRGNVNEWLFGGVERGTNGQRAFMVPVHRRSAQDLLPLIQQYIAPGSIIHSDMWRAYGGIHNLPQGYEHYTVNHNQNFVNPNDPNVHTQNIEGMWSTYKRKFRPQAGNVSETCNTYFPEFIWRKRFGDDAFYELWNHIRHIYPCQ